jgi:hypothetical protein
LGIFSRADHQRDWFAKWHQEPNPRRKQIAAQTDVEASWEMARTKERRAAGIDYHCPLGTLFFEFRFR